MLPICFCVVNDYLIQKCLLWSAEFEKILTTYQSYIFKRKKCFDLNETFNVCSERLILGLSREIKTANLVLKVQLLHSNHRARVLRLLLKNVVDSLQTFHNNIMSLQFDTKK